MRLPIVDALPAADDGIVRGPHVGAIPTPRYAILMSIRLEQTPPGRFPCELHRCVGLPLPTRVREVRRPSRLCPFFFAAPRMESAVRNTNGNDMHLTFFAHFPPLAALSALLTLAGCSSPDEPSASKADAASTSSLDEGTADEGSVDDAEPTSSSGEAPPACLYEKPDWEGECPAGWCCPDDGWLCTSDDVCARASDVWEAEMAERCRATDFAEGWAFSTESSCDHHAVALFSQDGRLRAVSTGPGATLECHFLEWFESSDHCGRFACGDDGGVWILRNPGEDSEYWSVTGFANGSSCAWGFVEQEPPNFGDGLGCSNPDLTSCLNGCGTSPSCVDSCC
jgi:hypothetical protein